MGPQIAVLVGVAEGDVGLVLVGERSSPGEANKPAAFRQRLPSDELRRFQT